jgi:hypothetical protein
MLKIVGCEKKGGKRPKQRDGKAKAAGQQTLDRDPHSGGGAISSGGSGAAADDFESADMEGDQHYPPGTPLDQLNLHRLKAYYHEIGATTLGADQRLHGTGKRCSRRRESMQDMTTTVQNSLN